MNDQADNRSSDLGRRLALRRRELGLSRAAVADRAGVAEEYLRYLEEHAASPTIGSLTRVAQALHTTIAELTGTRGAVTPGGTAGPGGDRSAGAQAGERVELDAAECRRLIAHKALGRAALLTPEGTAIVPVAYRLADSEIFFRLPPGAEPAYEKQLAFEVDHLDEAHGTGWSVQVLGRVSPMTEPREIAALGGPDHRAPSAEGGRERWVRLRPTHLSGHRIPLTSGKDSKD